GSFSRCRLLIRSSAVNFFPLQMFFFSSRRRHTRSVSAFLLNRSSDLQNVYRSGCVQQTYKHPVPRFFVPEHGTMFTLALVRFPRSEERRVGKECRSWWLWYH